MRRIMLSSLLALTASGAMAADFMAPPVGAPAAYDWSGFYIGVMGGALSGTASVPGPDGIYYGSEYGNVDESAFFATIGAGVGASVQYGSFVLGVDGDINWTNLEVNSHLEDIYYEGSAKWDWYATLRARAGVAVDNALIYATAGLAAVNTAYSACYYVDCNPVHVADYATNGVVLGMAAGIGTEVAIADNMSAKGELLYIGLPTTTVVAPEEGHDADFTSSAIIARVGLNWKLN